jgi:type II secretory pathway pseudopilin PulG
MSLRNLNARGDTIVEIMMVLAVLGLTLSISYATANHSLLAARQAQENSEASELLQSQVELVRYLAATTPAGSGIFSGGSAFCIEPGSSTPTPTLPSVAPGAATNPDCINQGQTDKLYDLSIVYTNVLGSGFPDTFIFTATWPDVQGQGTDTVTLTARIHPS